MNVYITKSNASKIIRNLNLSKIEIEGNLYKEEKNIEEIASISGLSVSNTKVKLHRIRKKLGEMVNEERDKNR